MTVTTVTEEIMEDLDLNHRLAVARKWALAARDVANESGVKQAQEIWDFLNNQTALGVPMPDASIKIFFTEEPDKSIEYAFLTPIIPADAKRLHKDDFRYAYAQNNAPFVAQFREGSRAIYFPEDVLSTKGKGIIMLHESMHAKNDIDGVYDRSDPKSHWVEEAEVYTLEFELLSALGGEDFEALVNECLGRFTQEESVIHFAKVKKLRAAKLWHKLFGADIAKNELDLWNYVAELDAIWRYFQNHSDDPILRLASCLSRLQKKP